MKYYIAGLDPGSTIGYALIDLDGKLEVVDSFKGSLNDTIFRVSSYGKVLIVGSDVSKISRTIEKFAATLGAGIVFPDHDLLFHEKRKKTKEFLKLQGFKLKNKHQRDALAAALVAYKHYRGLFNKIDNELDDRDRSNEIKREILVKNIPINKAKLLLED